MTVRVLATTLDPVDPAVRSDAKSLADRLSGDSPVEVAVRAMLDDVAHGARVVVLRADGCVLLRQRPEKGLLGAMTEVPGSDWSHDFDQAGALEAAPRFKSKPNWRKLTGEVTHVFTHFPLALTVYVAHVPRGAAAPKGAHWAKVSGLADEALPTVMRKVLAHALSSA